MSTEITDERIITALQHVDLVAKEITKLTAGSYNAVYKIVLNNDKCVVLRIFRSKSWPEDGKLEWIDSQLTKSNILNAPISFSTRDNTYFKNGYMIQEFIQGEIIENAVEEVITYSEYYAKLGLLMRQVHQIPVPQYGYIGHGTGNHSSFLDYIRLVAK